ncbi:precorrin-8X methylmutase [Leptospira langatensis]|uniref:Precorrin-8X methylmutase n=1 Tax=Leptospira langatensis TaxID=2484983 RepID=A0A5F1ZZD9_9LEPT|nr:precorrin-8X methylmutase [Leptospira langatensis]TGJ98434.1 precorrin-8X methylmutase [Leptospira langatensis]TGL43349.1 precorrin-8X methylmutase [Leptospira langatensis]
MSDMRQMTSLGREIENNSFSIIDEEAGTHSHPPKEWEVVRRIIHATADFEYRDLTKIHPNAISDGIQALRNGCSIICDVQMILAGLNTERLNTYGCRTYSFISDPDVIQKAKESNSTRAIESMRKAHNSHLLEGSIIAIGNAPTALLEIVRLVQEEGARPSLVIGVPVGFVSAAESKEALLDPKFQNLHTIPYILTQGRKGGSTIAVSIIHALLLLSAKENP